MDIDTEILEMRKRLSEFHTLTIRDELETLLCNCQRRIDFLEKRKEGLTQQLKTINEISSDSNKWRRK